MDRLSSKPSTTSRRSIISCTFEYRATTHERTESSSGRISTFDKRCSKQSTEFSHSGRKRYLPYSGLIVLLFAVVWVVHLISQLPGHIRSFRSTLPKQHISCRPQRRHSPPQILSSPERSPCRSASRTSPHFIRDFNFGRGDLVLVCNTAIRSEEHTSELQSQ